MRRAQTKRSVRIRLLTLVLVLALVWYSISPAPRPAPSIKLEDEPPDGKKREAEPQLQRAAILPMMIKTSEVGLGPVSIPNQDEDDFDWPEYINA